MSTLIRKRLDRQATTSYNRGNITFGNATDNILIDVLDFSKTQSREYAALCRMQGRLSWMQALQKSLYRKQKWK